MEPPIYIGYSARAVIGVLPRRVVRSGGDAGREVTHQLPLQIVESAAEDGVDARVVNPLGKRPPSVDKPGAVSQYG